ncbi:hypothetical protein N2152v2_001095 [Parachlorella kessleri]
MATQDEAAAPPVQAGPAMLLQNREQSGQAAQQATPALTSQPGQVAAALPTTTAAAPAFGALPGQQQVLPGPPGAAAAAAPPGQQLDPARQRFRELGATLLFEKVVAETHLPPLESQQGITLPLVDTDGKKHTFKFRFWINNQSRMYLLENTQEVQSKCKLQVGDVLVFGKLIDGTYIVTGRKGTKDDLSRKPPIKRATSETGGKEGARKGSAQKQQKPQVESLKKKRIQQKQAAQQVQSSYTYWNGYSLPARRDGVFRAVPNSAAQEGDKVVAQYGCWTAIVTLGGECFQAFFENYDAAIAAFEAARQGSSAA